MKTQPHSSLDLIAVGVVLFFFLGLVAAIGYCSHFIIHTILEF